MSDAMREQALSLRDRDVNAIRAGLNMIPNFGSSIEKLMFGNADELRWKRLERTLREVGEKLESLASGNQVDGNEDFANLLQDIAPPLSRSTNEDRRRRFRDLILNASQLPSGDVRWEEVHVVSRLLDSIGGPALSVLASIAKCSSPSVVLCSTPTTYVHDGEYVTSKPNEKPSLFEEFRAPFFLIPYHWNVVEEEAMQLKDMRLLSFYNSPHVLGGFVNVRLTGLGNLLIRWAVSDRFTEAD